MNQSFLKELQRIIPAQRRYVDVLRRLSWGTDAGFYRFIPQAVIQTATEAEVSGVVRAAARHGIPLTFRAAGTSLSGQAATDSVLAVAGKHWEHCTVLENGNAIRLQPGITGMRVNEILRPYGRKFAPDPASINSAMVGGIVMNNASGMSCSIRQNSYRMLRSARLILADGTLLDTGDPASREAFRASHPAFIRRIITLRDAVRADAALAERIRKKYSIKNVTGLSINPFLDFDEPFDIITHLIVGSEGTLAFLAEATMDTAIAYPCQASAMLFFADALTASKAVIALKQAPVTAVEFFDRKALRCVENVPDALPQLKLLPASAAALLVKTEAVDRQTLQQHNTVATATLSAFKALFPVEFTDVPAEYEKFWTMRAGIFPSVGGMRPPGTTCLIEDVAFPMEALAEATLELQQILERNGYPDAVIYGHALDGNYHFIINQSFDSAAAVAQYERLMHEVVDLVVNKYDGSLKAEHGTGRNMAPFVEKEWGVKAFRLMREIKQLFDPQGILNPGVIFNDDPRCFVKNFKPLPAIHPLIDKCIECGFCEINCLSCGFTLSSRQRIVASREIARLTASGETPAILKQLRRQFRYAGNTTCAGDGLCATSCPVGINVGDFIHELRRIENERRPVRSRIWKWTAAHFGAVHSLVEAALGMAGIVHKLSGSRAVNALGATLHAVSSGHFPLWTASLPAKNRPAKQTAPTNTPLRAVYFPSCLNQMMGASPDTPDSIPLMQKTVNLLNKAGYCVIFPENMRQLCCGTIWESKGLPDSATQKSQQLETALLKASDNGKYPVLCDQSPCLYRMRKTLSPKLQLFEPVEFIDRFLLERLNFHPSDEPVSIHATCSTIKMGLKPTLLKIAQMCSSQVITPEEVGCCGFAGDKGFFQPELNKYGLRKLRPQLEQAGVTAGYSNSRTCEIGLSDNGGVPYMSIVYLVDKCTTGK
ncbi:MAG: FAD-binding oxidoreductase [Bacteroidales bacterium]|jgi:D-lactate dehydrogenase|nr:FAD-binding oxidoreductase [Bacteroidales bacterium]